MEESAVADLHSRCVPRAATMLDKIVARLTERAVPITRLSVIAAATDLGVSSELAAEVAAEFDHRINNSTGEQPES
jgi:hypothetical protein